jgi:hypothetical protein
MGSSCDALDGTRGGAVESAELMDGGRPDMSSTHGSPLATSIVHLRNHRAGRKGRVATHIHSQLGPRILPGIFARAPGLTTRAGAASGFSARSPDHGSQAALSKPRGWLGRFGRLTELTGFQQAGWTGLHRRELKGGPSRG